MSDPDKTDCCGAKATAVATLWDAVAHTKRRANAARVRTLKTGKRYQSLNTALLPAGILLAAAAGLTILPDDVNRLVSAGLAFATAVATGLTA